MSELPNLIIPEQLRFTTGGDEEREIGRHVEEYFHSVRASIGLAAARADCMFRTYDYQLNFSDHHPSDDRVHFLTYRGRNPIANVLDWRDDSNFHVVSFGVYPIDRDTQAHIENVAREILQN